MTHIETIKLMKSRIQMALNSYEIPMTAGVAEVLAAANKAIGEGGPTEKQRSGSDSERTDPPSLDYDEAVRIQRASLAEQVHTPYCKQAPMCKTPCGNSDCVEQAEQEPDLWLLKLSDGRWGVALPEDEIPDDAQKQAFYAAPQKREWVELSLPEIQACCGGNLSHATSVHAAIAAFKEANK